MLLALNQLEVNGIIHGHITLESFFIVDDHLILNDITPFLDIMTDQQNNNVCYKSIEELSGIYNTASDLRRIGIILYILIFNRNPYPNVKSVFDEANGIYKLNFDGLEDEYKDILKMLLNPINITTATVLDKIYEIKDRREEENSDDDEEDEKVKRNNNIVNKNLNLSPPPSFILSATIKTPPNPIMIERSRGTRIGNYILGDSIGQGGCGKVYIGELTDNSDGKQYAIKIMDISNDTKELFLSEAKTLISLNEKIHDYIINFVDAFCEKNEYILVTEYCQFGDLRQELNEKIKKNEYYTSDEIMKYFYNLLKSLSELHKYIIHRDIKPANLFFGFRDNHRRLLYGDFGLCVSNTEDKGKELVGTLNYISPEILKEEDYGNLADCWSLGCVLYEMCTLQFLYSIAYAASERNTTKLDPSYPKCIAQIINGLTEVDKEKRMTASEALNLLSESSPLYG